jgi:hypothetical protein
MTKPIKTLVLLLWLLFIKYCLYVLKSISIVTYDMFYSTLDLKEFIFLMMQLWFSNQIFNLFVIPYHHEVFFCCNWNYSNEFFCMWQNGQLPLNNCVLQHGLVQQNNICGSNTYCYKIIWDNWAYWCEIIYGGIQSIMKYCSYE